MTTIKLNLKGHSVELTIEEARQLHSELDHLFARQTPQISVRSDPIPVWYGRDLVTFPDRPFPANPSPYCGDKIIITS